MRKITLVILIAALTSCASKIYPIKPTEGTIKSIEYKESSIALPFKISIQDINTVLNMKIPKGKIYAQKNGLKGFYRSDVELFRDSDIIFSANQNKLRFQIPIRIRVYAAKRKKILGINITKTGRGIAVANLFLDVDLKLNPDYTFSVNTNISYDLKQAEIRISLLGSILKWLGDPQIKISVKSLVRPELDKAIKKAVPDLNKLIENKLNEFNIKSEIAKNWQKLGQPIKLDENIWIESNPTGILFNNISSSKESIDIKAGIKSKLKLKYTSQPITHNPNFPSLITDEIKGGYFNIYLPTSIDFGELQSKLNNEVAGKTYYSENKKHKVTINNVEIFGSNNVDASSLVVGVDFRGKVKTLFGKRVKGKIWFTLFPKYDKIKKIIYLEDLKVTPQTNSVILDKAVPWLFKKFYMKKLLEESKFDFTNELKEQTELISEEISKIELDKLTINGNLSNLNFEGFHVSQEELILLLIAKGKLDTESIEIK